MEKQLHRRFHALGDPTRLAVVERLMSGPAAVSELARPFEMGLPAFTKHLRVLEDAGLVTSAKSGRVRTCAIAPDGMAEIEAWITDRRALWTARLDRLARHLSTPEDPS